MTASRLIQLLSLPIQWRPVNRHIKLFGDLPNIHATVFPLEEMLNKLLGLKAVKIGTYVAAEYTNKVHCRHYPKTTA